MTRTPTRATSKIAAAPVEPKYYEVSLDRVIEIRGHRYRPGQHVVDETTLAEMAEAVVHKRPVQG